MVKQHQVHHVLQLHESMCQSQEKVKEQSCIHSPSRLLNFAKSLKLFFSNSSSSKPVPTVLDRLHELFFLIKKGKIASYKGVPRSNLQEWHSKGTCFEPKKIKIKRRHLVAAANTRCLEHIQGKWNN